MTIQTLGGLTSPSAWELPCPAQVLPEPGLVDLRSVVLSQHFPPVEVLCGHSMMMCDEHRQGSHGVSRMLSAGAGLPAT